MITWTPQADAIFKVVLLALISGGTPVIELSQSGTKFGLAFPS